MTRRSVFLQGCKKGITHGTCSSGLGWRLDDNHDWCWCYASRITEWLKGKKEQQQSDIDFIIKNYRQRDLDQSDKLAKLEAKLLEVQQRVLDMQTKHIETLTENVSMKQKITMLEQEKNENSAEIVKLKAANTLLCTQVEDLERRIPK